MLNEIIVRYGPIAATALLGSEAYCASHGAARKRFLFLYAATGLVLERLVKDLSEPTRAAVPSHPWLIWRTSMSAAFLLSAGSRTRRPMSTRLPALWMGACLTVGIAHGLRSQRRRSLTRFMAQLMEASVCIMALVQCWRVCRSPRFVLDLVDRLLASVGTVRVALL